MNKKGFMMAELVVVSAIVLMFLAGVFISYNKIYSSYIRRLSYYDIGALYRLDFYQDYYSRNLSFLKLQARNSPFKIDEISSNEYNETAFIIHNSNNNLNATVLNNKNVNKTYQEYINYLSSSVDLTNTEYVMVLERCLKNDNDKCQYAYLELSTDELVVTPNEIG